MELFLVALAPEHIILYRDITELSTAGMSVDKERLCSIVGSPIHTNVTVCYLYTCHLAGSASISVESLKDRIFQIHIAVIKYHSAHLSVAVDELASSHAVNHLDTDILKRQVNSVHGNLLPDFHDRTCSRNIAENHHRLVVSGILKECG